jgi:hypothetical protein
MAREDPEGPLGLRDYLLGRKHDLTSSRRPSWAFVIHVLAEPEFPHIGSLPELLRHLREGGAPAALERSARSAWKSSSAYKSRHRAKVASRLRWRDGSRQGQGARK